jgi:hypothetical protein
MAEITVVDWLKNQLPSLFENDTNGFYTKMFEKAQEIHEEQIITAYKSDRHPCSDEDAEQYYNETYGTVNSNEVSD